MTDSFSFDADIADALGMIESLAKEVEQEVNKATKITAFKVMASAVKSISASPSAGIEYTRRGITHTASKAGDAPNTDTGNLVQSIKVRLLKEKLGGLDTYSIGSTLNYAAWLEFGTLDMSARPWLSPAVDKEEKGHIKRVTKAVRKGIQDAEQ